MEPELPTGIVTFVFTDVEGSTALLDDIGVDRYAAEALLLLDDKVGAASHLCRAMGLLDEIGDVEGLPVVVGLAAHVAVTAGDLRSAALLLGAHDELLSPRMRDPVDESLRAPVRRAVAAGLGDDAAGVLTEGAQLDLHAAVALARGVLERVASDGRATVVGSTLDSPDGPARP